MALVSESLQPFPCGTGGKEPACQCKRLRGMGLISRLGRSSGGGRGNTPVFLPAVTPRTEKPHGLRAIASQRVGHN